MYRRCAWRHERGLPMLEETRTEFFNKRTFCCSCAGVVISDAHSALCRYA
jgi:hypothetical protein